MINGPNKQLASRSNFYPKMPVGCFIGQLRIFKNLREAGSNSKVKQDWANIWVGVLVKECLLVSVLGRAYPSNMINATVCRSDVSFKYNFYQSITGSNPPSKCKKESLP